jgi:hypothetical protein
LSYQTLSGSLNGRPIRIPWLRGNWSAVTEIHDTPDTKKHLVHLEFGMDPNSWEGSFGVRQIHIEVMYNGDVFDKVLRLQAEKTPDSQQGGGNWIESGDFNDIQPLTILVDNTQDLGDSRILVRIRGENTGTSSLGENYLSILGYAEEVT